MRKRAVPENQPGIAPLTIGLGLNFVAGNSVDLAIETMWGDRLGEVIEAGAPQPLAGEPRPIGPRPLRLRTETGRFIKNARIGERVEEGAIIATIRSVTLRAPNRRVLRGLTRSGVEVPARTKVIEVDPRNEPAGVFGLGARPRRIAEGVLRAMVYLRVAEPA